jgi:preprotein translocase subunit SecA
VSRIEKSLGVTNIYERDFDTLFHIEAALKAQTLFKKDKDYIVSNDEVTIVDEFTGRLLHGRRFSEGLHQAIEAKERVGIKQESKTLATVSLQNYFRMYEKLAGMTGTAATEAEEFAKIYKTEVIVVPTHRPMRRQDLPDMIYKTENGKYNAVADEIAKQHAAGRPVLVGTTSIEKNEFLSSLLKKRGITHELLNAKNHEKEASIISKAGEKGAVTVATNMAGRGVDIILGGADGSAHDEVVELGGLLVIGTERHESRRIDNQLRGRSGRQGDPGSSQFFVSLEDDLMRIFGGEQISKLMTFFNFPEDQPLSHNMVSKAIESAQQKVEGHNFDIRKHLVEYDDVLNKQREIVYGFRRSVLSALSGDEGQIEELLDEKFRSLISDFAVNTFGIGGEDEREHMTGQLSKEISTVFRLPEDAVRTAIGIGTEEQIAGAIYAMVHEAVQKKKEQAGKDMWLQVVRYIGLSAVDNLWTEHLTAIEDLREGINLRGFGQMDPLIEYKNEAFKLFENLMHNIDMEMVRGIMHVEMRTDEANPELLTKSKTQPMLLRAAGGVDPYKQSANAKSVDTAPIANAPNLHLPSEVLHSSSKIGRNDPCWCGSGKKWKKCHYPQVEITAGVRL